MSYDLMVFRKEFAPKDKKSFMEWYDQQTEWTEDHNYDDPNNTSEELKNWFLEMNEVFPAMNGPYASDDIDDPKVTDYSIGHHAIYAAFAWSQAESAYETLVKLAEKHKVGFFDSSGSGEVCVPDEEGNLIPLNDMNKEKSPWWKFW